MIVRQRHTLGSSFLGHREADRRRTAHLTSWLIRQGLGRTGVLVG
jgi:hypothetical protein